MRISELSRRSGRSIATIKFYLREGLLAPGRRTAANQADYDDGHLRRLRLIATLIDVGGLSLAAVREVLAALDDDSIDLHDAMGVAHHGLATRMAPAAIRADEDTLAEVDALLEARAWHVKPGAPARRELAAALTALRTLGWQADAEVFEPYARAADGLAEWELAQVPAGVSRGAAVEWVVIGTVVFEAALVALRRLAEEHHSWLAFQAPDPGGR